MSVKYLNIWYNEDVIIEHIDEYEYTEFEHFGIASKDSINKESNDEFQIKIEWEFKC